MPVRKSISTIAAGVVPLPAVAMMTAQRSDHFAARTVGFTKSFLQTNAIRFPDGVAPAFRAANGVATAFPDPDGGAHALAHPCHSHPIHRSCKGHPEGKHFAE
jgi:hypothetical protein